MGKRRARLIALLILSFLILIIFIHSPKIKTMNKITLKALELAGYKDANTLAEIISYVPNPTVAAEMLLGLHQPIKLYDFGVLWEPKRPSNDTLYLIKVKSIDELADVVYYDRYVTAKAWVYYLTKDDFTNDIYQFEKPEGGNYYTSKQIRTKGFTIEENLSYTGVNSFESIGYKPVETGSVLHYLAGWQDNADAYPEPSVQVAEL